MTNITFTKSGKVYKAEFVLNDATPIHIERASTAPLLLNQRSGSAGGYVPVAEWGVHTHDTKIDTVLTSAYYPINCQLVTPDPVAMAYLG